MRGRRRRQLDLVDGPISAGYVCLGEASRLPEGGTVSRPIHIEESVTIRRAPEEVWAAVCDYATDHRWRPGITEMRPDPPGPPAVGTRVREVLRKGGRDYVTESTVTEVGPGMSYRFEGTGTTGAIAGGRRVTEARPDAAMFTYEVELTPAGFARLIGPLIGVSLRKSLRADLERLRDGLERGEFQPPGA